MANPRDNRRRPSPPSGPLADLPPWVRWAPIGVIALTALYIVWKGYFMVGATERAVVLRFGKVDRTVGPGLRFLFPFIEEAIRVDMSEKSMRLPFGSTQGNREQPRSDDLGLMMTAELNSAVVEWDVQYRVRDPQKFLFRIEPADLDLVLRAAAQSGMNRLLGDHSMDEALVGKREEIAHEARIGLQKTLDAYDCGIEIAGLQMQRIDPPTSVRPAHDGVNAAMQTREQLVNEAQKIRNQQLPKAKSEQDRMVQEAKGYAESKRLTIDGEVAALRAQYKEYALAPDIIRRRMYLEAMEHVLQHVGSKIIVDERLKQLYPILPLGGSTAAPIPQPPRRPIAQP